MAIKTKSELQTQSDNTFLDNNTGLIEPVNHRAYNDDTLDTTFAIAGREVTLIDYNDLRSNGDLVVGCRYAVTGVTLPAAIGSQTLYVTANTTSSVETMGYVFSGIDRIELIIDASDLSSILLADAKSSGGAVGNITAWQSLISASAVAPISSASISNSAIPKYALVMGRTAFKSADYDQIVINNIDAQRSQVSQPQLGRVDIHKGFFAWVPNDYYYYPDHGSQENNGVSTWGRAGQNAGGDGQLQFFLDGSNVNDVTAIKGNFLKVNDVIMGQVQADFDLTFGNGLVKCSFSLPHWGNGGEHTSTIMGHGTLFDTNHQINLDIWQSFTFNDRADIIFRIVGNHSGNISGRGCFTFSLSVYPL